MTCVHALPSTTSGVPAMKDGLRRELLKKMPIFEVQAAIDALYLYTHPAPDLTKAFGRIPLAANPGLCLDVPYGDPTPGNGLVVWYCNGGGAQQFSYDRETETIRNTALDRCIQVRPHVFNFPAPIGPIVIDNLAEMAIAESTICDSARPDRQKWTYNPQNGVIRSALGTVLDVQWGNLQAGTPVWMADYNGSGAQIWRADHSSEYCNGTCLSQCNAACAGAGPGTGSCMAGCMGSCVGNCMTTWP
jgi:hypothetical protein